MGAKLIHGILHKLHGLSRNKSDLVGARLNDDGFEPGSGF